MLIPFLQTTLKLSIFTGLLLLINVGANAQYEDTYVPIRGTGKIPASFVRQPLEMTRQHSANSKILKGSEAEIYYARMNFVISQIFKGGQLYLQNELTRYIDSVAYKLLVFEPKLKDAVHIYLTRYTRANAASFADGSVFFNIGLLALLDNETELAFILAHEIAHYAGQHNIKDLQRISSIKKQESNYSDSRSDKFLSLRFSRESEFEADSWALQLITQAGYDPALASGALSKLKQGQVKDTITYAKAFESSLFKIDTNWVTVKKIRNSKFYIDAEEESSLASGKTDDLFQTHPDLEKRVEALNLMTQAIKQPDKLKVSDPAKFNRIKEIAQFERIENNYLEQDYLNTIIHSLRLLEKYPENNYLQTSVARALYWLSYYKEINSERLNTKTDKDQNPYNNYVLYAMLNNMPLKDAKKLSYVWTKKHYDNNITDENLVFYYALCTENFLGKNAARNFYRDYYAKYPQGQFIAFAKNRLE